MPALRTAALAAAACLVLAACGDRAAPAPAPAAATPVAATAPSAPTPAPTAPDFDRPTLKATLLDGGSYDLATHRGKWVVVNFWATWCAPCLKEMPELSALHSMRDDVEVIGLAYEDIEPADMRDFLEKRPVTYPVSIVDTSEPPSDFETPRGLPMTILIAPDGRVAKKVLGPVTAQSLEAAIAAHPTGAKG